MKLLGTDGSPYVRKCRIAFEEKGIAYDYVTASPSNPASGVAAANPLSKIPTLVLDNGKGLYDSCVIVDYIDGLKGNPTLIPPNFPDRIEVRRWEALGNGLMDATVNIFHNRRLPADKQAGPEADAKQFKKINAGLAAMQNDLGARDFCFGNSLTLADIVCGVALGYMDRVLPDFDWRANYPGLKRHAARLAERPSFRKTLPVPVPA